MLHDLIKIKYVKEGYLPNYPYHMISDEEMFNAFLGDDGYFEANYPCINSELTEQFNLLKSGISEAIENFLEDSKPIPDWVYTYMLGNSVSVNSDEVDVDELCKLMNIKTDGQYDSQLAEKCYQISSEWIKKLPYNRPATIFGEPHVFKSLRLMNINVL